MSTSCTDEAVYVSEYVAPTPQVVRMLAKVHEDLGVDEVSYYFWAPDQPQIDRLQDALGVLS